MTYIDETEFFSAFHSSYQAAMTEDNIQRGFKGAGVATFHPEIAVSKLDVHPRTTTPPRETDQPPPTPRILGTLKTEAQFQSIYVYTGPGVRSHR
jgi:hypothetical protein